MWGKELILLFTCLYMASATTKQDAGKLYVFGKVGLETEAVALGSEHAEWLESESRTFLDVGAGDTMVAAVSADGIVERFDNIAHNASGKVPVEAPKGQSFCQVCRGALHTVVVTCDGEAFFWEAGRHYATLPDEPPLPPNTPIPLDVGEERVVQISCGQNHTLLLTESRNVFAFGMTSFGRLGIGSVPEHLLRVDVPVLLKSLSPQSIGDEKICSVEAGGKSSFAITESGKLYAWGANEFGQLGTGSVSDGEFSPVLVQSDPEFRVCEVASSHTFALGYDDNGDFYAWGSGTSTPTRFGSAPSTRAVMSGLESRTMQVAAGEFHGVILQDDNTVLTYGYNRFGQLGVVLNVPMPTDAKPEFEPDSPIWTLSPKVVEYLQGRNISSIYASGNYTAALEHVKTPHECPCARGGRGPRKFVTLGPEPTAPARKTPPVPPSQPMREPSYLFGPVAPYVGKSVVETAPTLPGEVDESSAPLKLTEVKPIQMLDSFDQQVHVELPERPATFFFYPEGSTDAKAFEDGVIKGESDELFGRHVTPEGYFYGDYDGDVADASYTRKTVMPNSRVNVLMPEKGVERLISPQSAGSDNLIGVTSLSLQDVKMAKVGEDAAMRQSTLSSVRDLKDTHPPVDFEKMHDLAPQKLDFDSSEYVSVDQSSTRNALQPHLLD